MNLLILTLIFIPLFSSPSSAQPRPLPEVIGVLSGNQFAYDYCWVGDQNEDGYDDLLISNDGNNRAEMFFGGEEMGVEPDFVFEPWLLNQSIRSDLNLVGHLLPGNDLCLTLGSTVPDAIRNMRLHVFKGEEDLDVEPDVTMSRIFREDALFLGDGFINRPADLNGDGFHDLIVVKEDPPWSRLQIFFGGEDFDTIPDWEKRLEVTHWMTLGINLSSGSDVNDDGFDDILLKTPQEFHDGDFAMYSLFLGGSPMDTVPVFSFRDDHFQEWEGNQRMDSGFSLLPDVNGDGYDDWGIYWTDWYERAMDDGFYIFFGNEEPDMEPDLTLDGNRFLGQQTGHLTGGDINGDGIGDIVTGFWQGNPFSSEVDIHFGSPWIDEEADIYIDGNRDYDGAFSGLGKKVGAVGDYNGDGIDDFAATLTSTVVVFAGNADWEAGVDHLELPETYEVSLRANPNPFNSELSIRYALSKSGRVRLSIYDINGREIKIIENRYVKKGNRELSWSFGTAGVYFVVLKTDYVQKAVKVVCIP